MIAGTRAVTRWYAPTAVTTSSRERSKSSPARVPRGRQSCTEVELSPAISCAAAQQFPAYTFKRRQTLVARRHREDWGAAMWKCHGVEFGLRAGADRGDVDRPRAPVAGRHRSRSPQSWG